MDLVYLKEFWCRKLFTRKKIAVRVSQGDFNKCCKYSSSQIFLANFVAMCSYDLQS